MKQYSVLSVDKIVADEFGDVKGNFAKQDGTILYHIVRWFTPTGTFSSTGTAVTTTGGQLTASMVGAKIGVGTDKRIITAFLTSNTCTVDSAFSSNYVSEPLANWGVYSKAQEITSTSISVINQIGVVVLNNVANLSDSSIRMQKGSDSATACGFQVDQIGGSMNRLAFVFQYGEGLLIHNGTSFITAQASNINFTRNLFLPSNIDLKFSSTTVATGTKDLGISRNAAGILEINNGTAGTFRDLRVRNVIPTLTTYATDAAADADSSLPSGAFYKLTGLRTVMQKP